MASSSEGIERPESRAMQREKERERRRLRDRQRRQNMTQEQRERHLARRRRNYQLRRMRAQNAKDLDDSPRSHQSLSGSEAQLKQLDYSTIDHSYLPLSLSSGAQDIGTEKKVRRFPRRLRLSDIRHLARRLCSDGINLTGGDIDPKGDNLTVRRRRLKLIHVKRLARTLKVDKKQDSS